MLAMTTSSALAADDDAYIALAEKASACIRGAAPQVERAEAALSDGADFILNDLCAVEVAAVNRYQRGQAMLQTLRASASALDQGDGDGDFTAKERASMAAMRKAYAKATIDPDTGEIVWPEGTPTEVGGMTLYTSFAASNEAPPELRSLAGRELLAARLARLSPR
ncbi:MAG: hypothetical protein JWP35_2383 [Caulobacter sp.]|nr:hypothetical protein [Caulobacter sp.]